VKTLTSSEVRFVLGMVFQLGRFAGLHRWLRPEPRSIELYQAKTTSSAHSWRGLATSSQGKPESGKAPGHSRFKAPKVHGGVVTRDSRAGGGDELWTGEFCCLFYGYRTRCLACPLPKAVQDLFEDGTLNASRFRAFGKKDKWQDYKKREFGAHDHSRAHYEHCLDALGFSDKRPKTLRDIKTAFRKKAKELHPDVGGDDVSFREIVNAYETAKALFPIHKS